MKAPSFREQLEFGVHSAGARLERGQAIKRLLGRFHPANEEEFNQMKALREDEFVCSPLMAGALRRLSQLEQYEEAEHIRAKIMAMAEAESYRRGMLKVAYGQGRTHGMGYGLVYGIFIGAALVAGLLMLGVKVGP